MPTAHPDEATALREMVERIVLGDEAGLAALYGQLGPQAFAIARAVLGPGAQAERALHDAFLGIWREARRADAERRSISSWVLASVWKVAIARVPKPDG